jgi:SAM-dependent methyltransferase
MILKKDSTFRNKKDLFMCSLYPSRILDIVISELQPTSVLDVGCGVGKSLEHFIARGIYALGIENSNVAINHSTVKEYIIKQNLKKELDLKKQFDLIWCFEVVEHIHPKYENIFLKTLCNHSKRILISAARPGQGGHGHFNEQHPEYWVDKFNQLGYIYEESFSNKLKSIKENHSENILYFTK